MSSALSIDPLTARLSALTNLPLVIERTGHGLGSVSQRDHVTRWNGDGGIRELAATSGLLTNREDDALKHGLDNWSWLSKNDRKTVNSVVNILFYIRRHYHFEDFNRLALNSVPHFILKSKKDPVSPEKWRTSKARRQQRDRSSFASL